MRLKNSIFYWLAFLSFVFFYPMLISIYVFLPLFIGAISYVMIYGLETKKPSYVLMAMLYMLNMEINLSLPIFLILISTLIFYLLIYPKLKYLRLCVPCRGLISVFFLDFIYLGILFGFDIVFQTQSIELDMILLYSLIIDMIVVVIL